MKTPDKGSEMVTPIRLLPCALAVLMACVDAAQSVTLQADTWVAGPISGNAVMTPLSGGSVTIHFPAVGLGTLPASGAAFADSSDPSIVFSGDYVAADVQFVRFTTVRLNAYNPAWGRVLVNTSSGRQWINYNVHCSSTSLVNNVGMNGVVDGWLCLDLWGAPAEEIDAAWWLDVRSVENVGVELCMNGINDQSYTLSDFEVQAARAIASLTPLEQALFDHFGETNVGSLSAEQLAQDQDFDGMTDADEIRAVYEPGYFATNLFAADILSIEPGFATLRWACVVDKHYTVLEAADLLPGNDFMPVSGKENLMAPETGYMQTTVGIADDAAPYFFKVRQED